MLASYRRDRHAGWQQPRMCNQRHPAALPCCHYVQLWQTWWHEHTTCCTMTYFCLLATCAADVADVVALQPTVAGVGRLGAIYYAFFTRPSPFIGAPLLFCWVRCLGALCSHAPAVPSSVSNLVVPSCTAQQAATDTGGIA